jgi:glycine/D-amino acid oxidase-like deaminating enzyme
VVRLGVSVTGIRVARGAVRGVDTSAGPVDAGTVVLTAGAGTPELLGSVGRGLPVGFVRHQIVRLHRPLDRLPTHPTVGDVVNALSFRPDSGDVTLVGIREDPAERDGYRQAVDGEVAGEAMRATAARMPAMADAGWDGGWAGLFDVTPDWHPVIDRVPGVAGLVCGVGFSGHGFKLSPAVGQALAELAVHGEARTTDVTPLRFTRFEEGDLLRSAYGGTVFA